MDERAAEVATPKRNQRTRRRLEQVVMDHDQIPLVELSLTTSCPYFKDNIFYLFKISRRNVVTQISIGMTQYVNLQ